MRRTLLAFAVVPFLVVSSAFAGEAEIKAAQTVIDSQLKAFQAGDGATAYSFAAPNIEADLPDRRDLHGHGRQRLCAGAPAAELFLRQGRGDWSRRSIVQQVLIVGPDGKDYEAVYTLEQQPDGSFRITGVSLRASNSVST